MDAAPVRYGELLVRYVDELAQRAARLGSGLVRVFSSYERDDVPLAKQWQITVSALQACCDRAGEHGVSIALQNHHDLGVDTRAFVELIEQVDRPNLELLFDCWSNYLLWEDVLSHA